jgi:hypothetical protein
MIITSLDGISNSFTVIQTSAREVAMEVMSKAGHYAQTGARNKMKTYSHRWFRKAYEDGIVRPYYSRTETKELGLRVNKNGDPDSPKSMANFITSFLMEKSETLIVGGTHKRFRPLKRREGKVVGYAGVVGGVSRATQAILNKMDTGTFNQYYVDSGEYKNPNYETRPFMVEGFRSAEPKIRATLTTEYIKIVKQALGREKVPVIKRRIA